MRKKSRPGPIVIQVARTEGSIVKESKAVIWIILNEGEENEKIQKIEVAVTDRKKEKLAWEIGVDGTVTETEVTKEKPITAKEMEK
jgi:hypothetical protein